MDVVTADPAAGSLRELNRWLRNYAGINPTSQKAPLLDLACVGATIVMWRNGPLEDIHAGDPGIRDVERANTATWAHVRAAIHDGQPPWPEIAARISDVGRSLTESAWRQRSSDGVTLADLIPNEADRTAIAAHAADQADLLTAVDDVVGRPRVLRALAAFGASYGSGWLGTPWWGPAVYTFLAEGDEEGSRDGHLGPSVPPPADFAALVADRDEFRTALAFRPYVLPLEALGWCLRAGLPRVVHQVRQFWLDLKAPDRPPLAPNLVAPERMRFGGWPTFIPLPTQWVLASRRSEILDRST